MGLKKNNRGQATEKIEEEEEKTTKDEKLFVLILKYNYQTNVSVLSQSAKDYTKQRQNHTLESKERTTQISKEELNGLKYMSCIKILHPTSAPRC